MVTNLTVKKNVNNLVLLNSCKQIFARLKKKLDHVVILLSVSILTLRWELVKSFTLEDVKVISYTINLFLIRLIQEIRTTS